MTASRVAIIGGGPAGLMAAQVLAEGGAAVTIFDVMPSLGRKLLLAGKSGLNLTHAEPYERFAARFGAANAWLRPVLDRFSPDALRAWADALGAETFVGSSGRVFPRAMKASPLLRAWLARLEQAGVRVEKRHRWTGWEGEALLLETPGGVIQRQFDAVLLALGGASWPRLGSDAAWVPLLAARGVEIASLRPANCGFDVAWSQGFVARHAGAPLKSVTITSSAGTSQGEFVISRHGVEGSLVYAHAAALRDLLDAGEQCFLQVDLAPGRTVERLAEALARDAARNAKESLSNRLRKTAGLSPVKAALLREVVADAARLSPVLLAQHIKGLRIPLVAPRPIAEAISTAGGIHRAELDTNFMLTKLPGVFAAGEMLDWEAPTGGYLLTACFATGKAAGEGMLRWLKTRESVSEGA